MNDTAFPPLPGGANAVPFTICSLRAGFRVKYFLQNDSRSGKCHMPAVAYKERPHRSTHRQPEPRPPQRRLENRPQQQPRLKTFHARLLVTRAEEWWVEAHSAEEAKALLAAGQGHHVALGERLHVELEEALED